MTYTMTCCCMTLTDLNDILTLNWSTGQNWDLKKTWYCRNSCIGVISSGTWPCQWLAAGNGSGKVTGKVDVGRFRRRHGRRRSLYSAKIHSATCWFTYGRRSLARPARHRKSIQRHGCRDASVGVRRRSTSRNQSGRRRRLNRWSYRSSASTHQQGQLVRTNHITVMLRRDPASFALFIRVLRRTVVRPISVLRSSAGTAISLLPVLWTEL